MRCKQVLRTFVTTFVFLYMFLKISEVAVYSGTIKPAIEMTKTRSKAILATMIDNKDLTKETDKIIQDDRPSHRHFDFSGDKNLIEKLSLPVNCKNIIEGDEREISKAHTFMKNHPVEIENDSNFIKYTQNCEAFKKTRGYVTRAVTKEEEDFPIAYSILMYKDIAQTERLLRIIYRPQNVICIHVDRDSHNTVYRATKAIASCFENVFLTTSRERITYAGFSRLKADINCMEDTLKQDLKWKYYINLASQVYPLKTNLEMVKILKIYNGANDIEGISAPHRMMKFRYEKHHKYAMQPNGKAKLVTTDKKKDPAPHKLNVVKGSAYGIFSRELVDFIVHDKKAIDLLEWSRDVKSPDEYYWSTLHHNPQIGVPGSYTGKPDGKPWLAVYASWCCKDPCKGKVVRGVCVFGIGDLPHLISRKELFANKFYLDYQNLAIDCLEEWLLNKTYADNIPFDSYYYRNLPFIKK